MRGIRGERTVVRKLGRWLVYATPYDSGDVLLEADLGGEVRKDWIAKMKPNGGIVAPPLGKALAKAERWVRDQSQGEDRAEKMLAVELKRISLEG